MHINQLKGFLFVVALLLLQACSTLPGKNSLHIGKDGNITSIVLPSNADPVLNFAASELQSYFNEITGTTIQIMFSGSAGTSEKAIRFSVRSDTTLKWDGFRITADRDGLTITSNEARGILYGVYQLLEQAGCSFVYPGKAEEIVPRKASVEFQAGQQVFTPLLEHRGLTPYGLQRSSVNLGRKFIDWMAKNKLNYILVSEERPSDCPGSAHGDIWKEVSSELLPELQNRGFVIEMSEHTLPHFFPRSLFKEHPEWFSLINGKRKAGPAPYFGNMCYSNKDAVNYYANALATYAQQHPEFHVIGTWPLDGSNYCQCENCRDPQTIFNAVKQVAETIKKVRPDIIVEHLAYRPLTWVPPHDASIPKNISVLWCLDNGIREDLAAEWVGKEANAGGVYQFEYYMGDNYRSKANLWLRPENAVDVAMHARDMGYRGIISLFLPMENWWRTCFNCWFFAKACWDPSQSIPFLLHEYCRDYYGADSTDIENVFNSIFTELQPEPYLRPEDEAYAGRLALIDPVALKILNNLDIILQREQDVVIRERIVRLKTYVEFFRLYSDAFSSRKPGDLDKLVDYSRSHPNQNMVVMYPDYIRWRLEELF